MKPPITPHGDGRRSLTTLAPEARPRERLLRLGARALSDSELLAIFLRTGIPGRSALGLAEDLLERFDGISGLLDAQAEEVMAAPGLGQATFTQLAAVLELSRRHWETRLVRPDALTHPGQCRDYLKQCLGDEPHEVFAALFLDNRHRPIAFERLFHGTIDGASVHPRVVVSRALRLNAAALIVAHNHPSGISEASAADCAITRRLKDALALVDIRLLDHFIVGDGAPFSMAERGLL